MFEQSFFYIDSNDLSLKEDIYCNLAHVYHDQGRKGLAIKMMEEALKYSPNNKFFRQFRRVVDDKSLINQEENEIFYKLLYYDLGNIIKLCHLYNIEIILLNYPIEGKNSIRKAITEKYKVTFVDIDSKFAELLPKYNYKDLFSNDAYHPNANGYRVMAETVFEVFKREIGAFR